MTSPRLSDLDHIQTLAQIGLVFLMFGIGLGLSFARLQRMGLSIFFAVIISSIFLFNLCRLFGVAMGWNSFQTFFLAGTLMISSSAIIIKILDELNVTHQRAGQRTLIPSFSERLQPGYRLLVLGTHHHIQRWRNDLAESSAAPEPVSNSRRAHRAGKYVPPFRHL